MAIEATPNFDLTQVATDLTDYFQDVTYIATNLVDSNLFPTGSSGMGTLWGHTISESLDWVDSSDFT